jgi:hypothetical protein
MAFHYLTVRDLHPLHSGKLPLAASLAWGWANMLRMEGALFLQAFGADTAPMTFDDCLPPDASS